MMRARRPRLRRREIKLRVRETWKETFGDLDPTDDTSRATRIGDLCPCEYPWDVPLWDIIFAACADPSPLVRLEALHVIEDSYALDLPLARGWKLLCAARNDPAPEIRRFAKDV